MISLPDRRRFLLYLKLTSLLSLQFAVIYGGANWLTQFRPDVHQIYFDWELAIPLVPLAFWIYASIIPLTVLPLILLDKHRLEGLASQIALAMLIAGGIFLVFPGQTGYPPPAQLPQGIDLIRKIDLPYNVFPSLHVAFSTLIMSFLCRVFEFRGRFFLAAWFLAIIVSVILTHQHHVMDVLGGLALVWLCRKLRPQDIS